MAFQTQLRALCQHCAHCSGTESLSRDNRLYTSYWCTCLPVCGYMRLLSTRCEHDLMGVTSNEICCSTTDAEMSPSPAYCPYTVEISLVSRLDCWRVVVRLGIGEVGSSLVSTTSCNHSHRTARTFRVEQFKTSPVYVHVSNDALHLPPCRL
jgi:hypothetical protein